MASGSGRKSVPSSSSIDKSRVLDVKPLRSLEPLFSSPTQGPPFVFSSPLGPFPPGFSTFYPFSTTLGSQSSSDQKQQSTPAGHTDKEGGYPCSRPIITSPGPRPAPIRSYRTAEPPKFSGSSNGDTEWSRETSREVDMTFTMPNDNIGGLAMKEDGFIDNQNQNQAAPYLRGSKVLQKKAKKSRDVALSCSVDGGKGSRNNFTIGFSSFQRDDGNREMVNYVLLNFDSLRRRLSQIEDAKEAPTGIIKRADLKSASILMSKGLRTNLRKRIGIVPGVEIGDIFFFRMEMCLVGLHSQSMGGIDYMMDNSEPEEEPLAISIVSSGGYDDDVEDRDVLIYSGQGGNINKKDKQVVDQKLERGNLALERSLHRANEVRVIRGMKDAVNSSSKVYVYDGLYTIQESWMEKGKSGFNIFKYKLVRIPGQLDAFARWKSIQKWKEGLSSRAGLILLDLTSGAESIPVSLVNDIDDEKGPSYFTYFPTLKYSKSVRMLQPSFGCDCHSACLPGDLNCSCIRKNGGDFPYTANCILVNRKAMVHECGPTCPCFPDCKNRVSQTGLKVHLEVFKTTDRGWGLRSLDPIRAGTFICEYAGEVIESVKVNQDGDEGEKYEYVLDTTRIYDNSFKWNYEPELLDEETSVDANEDYKIPSPLIINAKNVGNVARFINHSCSPNVFWQPVVYEHNSESFVHIAIFAIKHIPPMMELTYDYGMTWSGKNAGGSYNASPGKKKCLCGTSKCRGYFA
ncbi:histone-lysine N-methyltransferase, H3 lysine-9 specific SUVH1 [Cornus florida]|uniref:histone-lysine N-methyltransferase, H3 lysine-9 specific SUVH1 n=1 Tax=Cornus florida TaxID=4283 RepID=UPI002896F0E0|nr:histone-lysine N-methyltransferase, H3 lysine-9 specific SUVH1 [Cornus florida]XP_059653731.1 histone-lysine N-methyltransferase, H3 lysine-9 specific SUVH1 [Cornus florida]